MVALTLSDAARKRLGQLARTSRESRSALVERLLLEDTPRGRAPGAAPRSVVAGREAAARVANELDTLEQVFVRARKAAATENVDPAVLANFLLGFVEPAVSEAAKSLRALLAPPPKVARRKDW